MEGAVAGAACDRQILRLGLAVASMAAFSIYLRQRGSPQSKPVGTAHGATGVEG
ncbi:DUF6766 family protein [Actinomadura rugatobispora]|uniref:DUF6766 family protein n=1 Tax=Actinomadura rugatobispora TaxID=1994 RepID=A0ABW1A7Q7_9ACTN|nr:hypothetical protein GCM10010200_004990 [Actinomadura rugatobispora]